MHVRGLAACAAAGASLVLCGGAGAGTVVLVDDDRAQCPDAKYAEIQPAVDAAAAGDTVRVCPGRYLGAVVVAKTITLSGSGPDPSERTRDTSVESVVSGTALGSYGFDLQADGVVVEGFTIVMPGDGVRTSRSFSGYAIRGNLVFRADRGLLLNSSGTLATTVERNLVTRSRYGVVGALRNGSFVVNELEGNGRPGSLSLYRASFADNEIGHHGGGGLWIDTAIEAEIARNAFSSLPDALTVGRMRASTIAANRIEAGSGYGIMLRSPGGSRIEGNVVVGRLGTGIVLRGGGTNTLYRNAVYGAGVDGISVEISTGNSLVENAALANGRDGIRVDVYSESNVLERNVADGNLEHDCHDDSTGTGTAGTANTWTANVGETAQPAGICRPVSAG